MRDSYRVSSAATKLRHGGVEGSSSTHRAAENQGKSLGIAVAMRLGMGIIGRASKAISSVGAEAKRAAEATAREKELEEITVALACVRREIVGAVTAEKALRTRRDALRHQVDGWDQRALRAVEAGEDALAQEAMQWKTRIAAELAHTEARRAEELARAFERRDAMRALEARHQALSPRQVEPPKPKSEVDFDLMAIKARIAEESAERSFRVVEATPARVRVEIKK